MTKVLFLGFFCLIASTAKCQDLIITFNKDTLKVNVSKSTPEIIEYTFGNEKVINIKSKKEIYKVIYASGRIEICNKVELPTIKSKKDWEKVIITLEENDVVGLVEVGTVKGDNGAATGLAGAAIDKGQTALKQLKKRAAEIGAPIVLIIDGWNKEKDRPATGALGYGKVTGKAFKEK
jgi:hypothetical protein